MDHRAARALTRSFYEETIARRGETGDVLGVRAPKSAELFLAELSDTSDQTARHRVYHMAYLECMGEGFVDAAIAVVRARLAEFDDSQSRIMLSDALGKDGDTAAAVEIAREALAQSISDGTAINQAAGNLVRQAIRTGSVDIVNAAFDDLVDSIEAPRRSDVPLEADWADDAEALGADADVIAWIREVERTRLLAYEKAGLTPNGRKRRTPVRSSSDDGH